MIEHFTLGRTLVLTARINGMLFILISLHPLLKSIHNAIFALWFI